MITPQFHYSLFSHRMRFPAVTGGLFLPQNFLFQHPVNENCAEAQFNRWWSERPVHTSHRVPRGFHTGTVAIPHPEMPA
ncbi:hypothetical protein F2N21_08455 [Escherichia coli]|nr:hypothetical protein [Escherichia coli]EEW3260684.1 hypothetical protein [Escherichia coli]EFB2175226.1 hypothetical protein [Escherichia coli]EFB2816612.1 hypothetical protein [Escherichia coli]EFC2173886.1 hypothetical protein [Escherichia coli]